MMTKKRSVWLVGAIMGLSVALTACGNSEDNNGPSDLGGHNADTNSATGDTSGAGETQTQEPEADQNVEFVTVDPGDFNTVVPRSARDALLTAEYQCNEITGIYLAAYAKAVSGMDNDMVGDDGRLGIMQVSDRFVEEFGVQEPELQQGAADPSSAIWAVTNVACAHADYVNRNLEQFLEEGNAPTMASAIWAAEYPDDNVSIDGMGAADELIAQWMVTLDENGMQFE